MIILTEHFTEILCDHDLVGGIANVVWFDVVDAALLGPGEGGDRIEEEEDGQEHHYESRATELRG